MIRVKRKATSVLLAVVTALLTVVVPAVIAPPSAAAYACNARRDSFTGSVARMEHYLRCNHIHFDVVDAVGLAPTARPALRTPGPGGPPCEWQVHRIVKICFQRGVGHLICEQYFGGSYYPYHCGPLEAYRITHYTGLWHEVKRFFHHRAVQACVRGSIGGAVTATIIRVAGASTGGIGIIASMTGGCVGGIVTFFWKV